MRIAYADPPYPGQAKRWYGGHPDYAGEVDHSELVARLNGYDGWALSTSAAALQGILALCPAGVRVAVWYRSNSEHPGNRGTWWWSWEPVIVCPARPPAVATRDMLSHHKEQGFLGSTIPGQKPRAVCEWLFALVGARPDDELHDLFPGSGAVSRAWEAWRNQLTIGAA
jgi:hypothetical protein